MSTAASGPTRLRLASGPAIVWIETRIREIVAAMDRGEWDRPRDGLRSVQTRATAERLQLAENRIAGLETQMASLHTVQRSAEEE